MAINISRETEYVYMTIKSWDCNGHEVALMQLKRKDEEGTKWSTPFLECECRYNYTEEQDEKGRISRRYANDPHRCQAKKVICNRVMGESRNLHGADWKQMGVEEAILNIYRRVESGEFLGQYHVEMIYVQEVAELLEVEKKKVWSACDSLFAKDKLALSGAILCAYVPHFHFPRGMQSVLAYIVEEPMGWPNGDAGDFFVGRIEADIEQSTRFKHGRDAFGKNNYPHINPAILADYAFDWLVKRLQQAACDTQALEDLRKLEKTEVVNSLADLSRKHPDIAVEIFAEFVYQCVQLSLERIEIDRQMRPGMNAHGTLLEMADHFNGLAKRCRKS